MQSLKQDFIEQGMELRETHISLVFLTEQSVYKVKKPVALGFLDFTTLDARKRFCEIEVALNQRLAPDVYRGVVPILRDAQGVHRIGGTGEASEWAVEMRRLPDRDCAQTRLYEGRLDRHALERLAAHLARFHAQARCDEETSRYGRVDAIETNVRENFEQTRQSAVRFLSAAELVELERWQLGFLRQNRPRFEARIAGRRARDCHGDLRLEHCYLDDAGTVAIIDCIEFSDRFRYGDVASDVAFLAMDLTWHGRHDLSEAFLAAYARAACDYDLYGVVDFYESYRAYVRGKVSSMLQDDPGVDPASRARAAAHARKYYLLAEACAREPLHRPVVYAVGGVIASGKSTVAEHVAGLVHAPVIDADRARKQLSGVESNAPLHDPVFAGHYDQARTAEVYAELMRRAAIVLESKRSVVLDASFRDRHHRSAALELAKRFNAPFLFIECSVDLALCRQRLRARAQSASVSDGRLEVFEAFVASFEPVDELTAQHHLRVDTGRSVAETISQIRDRLL